MDTCSDRLLGELAITYGEFWTCWLVPTTIGASAGVWCARLHAGRTHYVNAATPAMLHMLIEKDDQLAGRRYSAAGTANITAQKPGCITRPGPGGFTRTATGDPA